MNKFKENFQFYLIKSVLMFLSLFPRKFMGKIAIPAGLLWHLLDRRHRTIARENMAKAYGLETDDRRICDMSRANFIHLARATLEIPSLYRINEKNFNSYVEFENEHYLMDEIARGKGVLMLTGHMGNWELMNIAAPFRLKIPVYALVRPLDFAPLDRIISELRMRTGNIIIDKDKSAGTVMQLLQENNLIAILLDQNSSWYEGVYVPFFGRTACTNKGMAMLAIRCNVSVLPVFNYRREDGRYRIVFDKPLELIRTDDIESDIVENTKVFNEVIEKHVRMAPDNWLWVHRRWRIKDIPEEAVKKIRGSLD